MGADVWTTARTMPEGYDRPDRFIEADTSTAEGVQSVAARIAEGGALDILVHVVGGSSTPPGDRGPGRLPGLRPRLGDRRR